MYANKLQASWCSLFGRIGKFVETLCVFHMLSTSATVSANTVRILHNSIYSHHFYVECCAQLCKYGWFLCAVVSIAPSFGSLSVGWMKPTTTTRTPRRQRCQQ